jgi:glycerol-3-phosphate dehydrogenase
MAGVRALVRKEGVREGQVSRKHAIHDHRRRGGPDGLISVLGGKITAYRDIAEEVTDLAARRLGHRARSSTARAPLPGGDRRPDAVVDRLWPRAEELGLGRDQVDHLAALHGSHAESVLQLAERQPRLAARFCEHGPSILAQALYAVRDEGARSLADVLLRRAPIGLASCLALDGVDRAAEVIGEELAWTDARRAREIVAYREHVAERYAAPGVEDGLQASA